MRRGPWFVSAACKHCGVCGETGLAKIIVKFTAIAFAYLAWFAVAEMYSASHPRYLLRGVFGSPQSLDSVSIQRIVTAHERQVLRQTLRDQHPVKGITVVKGKPGDLERMSNRDVKNGEAIERDLLRNKFLQGLAKSELAQTGFDGDFPDAGDAQETFVVAGFQQCLRLDRQTRRVGDKPEKRVGVGEESHSM